MRPVLLSDTVHTDSFTAHNKITTTRMKIFPLKHLFVIRVCHLES